MACRQHYESTKSTPYWSQDSLEDWTGLHRKEASHRLCSVRRGQSASPPVSVEFAPSLTDSLPCSVSLHGRYFGALAHGKPVPAPTGPADDQSRCVVSARSLGPMPVVCLCACVPVPMPQCQHSAVCNISLSRHCGVHACNLCPVSLSTPDCDCDGMCVTGQSGDRA